MPIRFSLTTTLDLDRSKENPKLHWEVKLYEQRIF